MKYAEITITVHVDESKFTEAHQQQANRADTDPFRFEHPAEPIVDQLREDIVSMVSDRFNSLTTMDMGAVTIEQSQP